MNYQLQSFRYRVAVGITFKKLRVAIKIDNKAMTQQYINNDIFIKYSKSWNAAREEALPNTTLENLLLLLITLTLVLKNYLSKSLKFLKLKLILLLEKKILRRNIIY